jgi:GNAT superfamily N-acetyltransferase
MTAVPQHIEYREVDAATWPDLVHLFEAPGGPKYCWCLVWRESAHARKGLKSPELRSLLEQRVNANVPIGLLAYIEGEPAGWCSVAPRESYRPLGGKPSPGLQVWSIVCFYVTRKLRGHGISVGLLHAAIDLAARHGANIVEAYPVERESPSYRHMGRRSTFLAAGFEEVGMVGSRRHFMRLRV